MNKNDLLQAIQEVQFVCVDLNLYVDTHPEDEAALLDFNCYSEKLQALIAEYESAYGPLVGFGHSDYSEGSWVEQKWPWVNF